MVYVYHLLRSVLVSSGVVCFFFNDTATTEIYTLSLHDALPIAATSAAHSAANASTQAARRLGLGVIVLVSPIEFVNTGGSARLRPLAARQCEAPDPHSLGAMPAGSGVSSPLPHAEADHLGSFP